VRFWATVCKTVCPMLSDRCLSVYLPVLLDEDPAPPPLKGHSPNFRPMSIVATTGWIKMKFGMQVGLGPGHIVLDRDPAPLP